MIFPETLAPATFASTTAAGRSAGLARTISPLGRVNIAYGCRPATVNAGKNRVRVRASRGQRSRCRRRSLAAASARSRRSASAFSSSFALGFLPPSLLRRRIRLRRRVVVRRRRVRVLDGARRRVVLPRQHHRLPHPKFRVRSGVVVLGVRVVRTRARGTRGERPHPGHASALRRAHLRPVGGPLHARHRRVQSARVALDAVLVLLLPARALILERVRAALGPRDDHRGRGRVRVSRFLLLLLLRVLFGRFSFVL